MSKPFDRLQSVLKLEAQQGFKNKAVVGGIRQFASFWVEQARELAIDEADSAFIEQAAQALTDYGQTSGNGRKMLVARLIDKLDERKAKVAASQPKPPQQSKPSLPPEAAPKQKPPPPPEKKAAPKQNRPVEKKQPESKMPVKETAPDPVGLAQSVETIKGVGPKIAILLDKLGVQTIQDLLHVYPYRYDDYTTMKPINRLQYGEKVSLIGTIWEVRSRKSRNNQVIVSAVISDGTVSRG